MIHWTEIVTLLEMWKTQRYTLRGAQVPTQPLGVHLYPTRIGTERTNCCTFTAHLLSLAFVKEFSLTQWKNWMVSRDGQSSTVPGFGPRVCMEWGVASTSPAEAGPWLCQIFSNGGGHSFIIVDHDKYTDRVLTLESCGSLDGVGWRQIGAFRDVPHPGSDWVDKVTQTWKQRIDGVHAAHVVRLNITGVKDWLANDDGEVCSILSRGSTGHDVR
tara:strand:+ start:105 stop:749 length:645 start_codon:yes stop_codon:yes gene_type:complete